MRLYSKFQQMAHYLLDSSINRGTLLGRLQPGEFNARHPTLAYLEQNGPKFWETFNHTQKKKISKKNNVGVIIEDNGTSNRKMILRKKALVWHRAVVISVLFLANSAYGQVR